MDDLTKLIGVDFIIEIKKAMYDPNFDSLESGETVKTFIAYTDMTQDITTGLAEVLK